MSSVGHSACTVSWLVELVYCVCLVSSVGQSVCTVSWSVELVYFVCLVIPVGEIQLSYVSFFQFSSQYKFLLLLLIVSDTGIHALHHTLLLLPATRLPHIGPAFAEIVCGESLLLSLRTPSQHN